MAATAASDALDRPALSVRVQPQSATPLLPQQHQQQDQQETQQHWSASSASPVLVRAFL